MGLILNRLTSKFNTGSAKIINANSFSIDSLTKRINKILATYSAEQDGYLTQASTKSYVNDLYGYEIELPSFDVEIDENAQINNLTTSLKGQVDDEVLNNISDFSNAYSVQDNSILSVLWATIVNNSIKGYSQHNDEIIDIFTYVANNVEEMSLQDLATETLDLLRKTPNSHEYFNRAYISFSDLQEDGWYDFNNYPAEDIEDMVYDLKINNADELLEAVKSVKNLPSVIDYIKSTYTKADQSDVLRQYKSLAILTNIYNDKRYKEDPSFDKDNNIGLNLIMKLNKAEQSLKEEFTDEMENTNLIRAIKSGAKSVVDRKIIKKGSVDVYKKYLSGPVKGFIKKYEKVEEKVEELSFTQTVRDSLVDLGIIKKRTLEKDLIANQEYILDSLEDKISKAERLLSYLSSKNIDKLEKNPKLNQMYKEIIDWASMAKNTNDLALIIAKRNGITLYKDYVYLGQPANVIKKQIKNSSQNSNTQPAAGSSNDDEATQLTIDI